MSSIINEIVAHKHTEVAAAQAVKPLQVVRAAANDMEPPRDFAAALHAKSPVALIAEIKRKSPSKGLLRANFDPEQLAIQYTQSGASAISVLTDEKFFGGSLAYLQKVKRQVNVPLLRKDFIIDSYQVYQSKAAGADAILLIVAALEHNQLAELLALTLELQLAPLVEVHNADELATAVDLAAPIIGINNRDLRTFNTTLAVTQSLANLVPAGTLLVSESGISTRADIKSLQECGVHAVLVGESLVRQENVGEAVRELIGDGKTMSSLTAAHPCKG